MVPAATRIAHYEARMQSTLIDPAIDAVRDLAVANFTTYALDWAGIKQPALHGVLNADGIMGPIRFRYEAYAAELYGLTRRFGGTALDAMAQVMHDKYEAWGCATATLISIAATVFGITVT